MSKLNSTPDDQYFFIVSKYKGLALGISTGKKGGDLVLSEARGRSRQLWRLDEDHRLVSKLGLVADIKGKNKKPGTVCHAWKAHDGLNQKWHFKYVTIESDFNELVIDASTQPVSMHKADGSLPQMWYFVPRDAWPDGRLVKPSLKYFFIVNQRNKSVLEISAGKKGGDLVLSVEPGKFSQLWRLDEDRRLVSKLGLVADIKGKNKKPGAVCHAWNAHDGLNQKWHFEEHAIRSDLNNLVIDARAQAVSMYEVDGSLPQKWYFVPENAWPDGRLVVPSLKYFFIVSKTKKSVLEISEGKKGGDLFLSEVEPGKSSQLWRLDEDRRLVSKLGLVADIKGQNKKPGAVCHAWNAHDGLNQKWHFEDDAIKSDLNYLVIDARTQTVSMCEVDGSLPQKWYFVPENAWPDGRLVVPSLKYFYIVNKTKKSVLEISKGKKGGDLVLSEALGKPNQLWRLDEDRRLVSKLGLVADIKGQNKKPGAVCHAWNAHDGLNQKWHFEDDAIKSDFNSLVIDARNQSVSMHEEDGRLSQKWYFVPESAWPDGRLVVPSLKYFYIVNKTKKSVLEISKGKKGGDLVLSEALGKPNQLWRLDEDRRLVSKLGLVADIKGKKKKPGAVCHAWNAHDGLNQKWYFEDDAIKSDFNNLVITARNQSVSMHEEKGRLSQKWYFVPENAWPDGRLVVPSVKYFYIVNQTKKSGLDISTEGKDGDLVLSEANGKPSQLWRWDEDCRLVSKLGLVAAIKGMIKKAGAVCHAWKAHDGLNQKWRVEEGAIKSSLNDLVIDVTEKSVTMEVEEGVINSSSKDLVIDVTVLSVTIQVANDRKSSQKWFLGRLQARTS